MTPIEWMAALVSIIALVKFIMLWVNPQPLAKFGKKMTKNADAALLIYVLMLAAASYFVFLSFSIVQVMAVALWVALLYGLMFMAYPTEVSKMIRSMIKKPVPWPAYLWILLAVWCLKELFF